MFVALYLGACYGNCPSEAAKATVGLGIDLLTRHVELVTHPADAVQIAARDAAGALAAAMALHVAIVTAGCAIGGLVAACILRCRRRRERVGQRVEAARPRGVVVVRSPASSGDGASAPAGQGQPGVAEGSAATAAEVEIRSAAVVHRGLLPTLAAVARCWWYYTHIGVCGYACSCCVLFMALHPRRCLQSLCTGASPPLPRHPAH